MYARVTFGTVQLDKVDEQPKIVRDSILPVVKKQKGGLHPYEWTARVRRIWRGRSLCC